MEAVLFTMGDSVSRDLTPKLLKNSSVVPKSSGLPGASNRPTSVIRLNSSRRFTAWSQLTPRIFSISSLVTGCL